MVVALIDDALCARIEPLLPRPPRKRFKTMGRPRESTRATLAAVFFALRTGMPSADAAVRGGMRSTALAGTRLCARSG